MRHVTLLVLAALLLPASSLARTWHINPDGTGDAPTIQAGVDSSAVGDTVQVACGVYHDCRHEDYNGTLNCIVLKPGLVLRSTSGDPSCVTIDAEGLGRCLALFSAYEPTIIEGLTFTGGSLETEDGGGAFVFGADESVQIRHCLFTGNYTGSAGGGGGLACSLFRGTIEDCEFVDNSAPTPGLSAGGGGARLTVAWPTIRRCRFVGNNSNLGAGLYIRSALPLYPFVITDSEFVGNDAGFRGGAVYAERSTFTLHNSLLEANHGPSSGGGLVLIDSNVDVETCRFVGNSTQGNGGAIFAGDDTKSRFVDCLFLRNTSYRGGAVSGFSNSITHLESSTFVGNYAVSEGPVIYSNSGANEILTRCLVTRSGPGDVVACAGSAGPTTVTCSDIYGNDGGDWTGCLAGQEGTNDNFSMDPHFCDPDHDLLTLRSDSPCAFPTPGWRGCDGPVGAFPVGCGPMSVAPESWARVKARYR